MKNIVKKTLGERGLKDDRVMFQSENNNPFVWLMNYIMTNAYKCVEKSSQASENEFLSLTCWQFIYYISK